MLKTRVERSWATRLIALWLVAPLPLAAADSNEAERIRRAIGVLQQLTAAPDVVIPQHILDRAEAVVVIPNLVKGGFVVGAEHGKGVMSVRNRPAGSWSPPSFVKLTGGSFGWQIGLQAVDLVLVVMNREGVEDLLRSEFTLGAGAGVAAGPVGRNAEASTDALMGAKILAYSRAKGLFAGATVEGASLRSDDGANRTFYGRPVSAAALAASSEDLPALPPAGRQWRAQLARLGGPARTSR